MSSMCRDCPVANTYCDRDCVTPYECIEKLQDNYSNLLKDELDNYTWTAITTRELTEEEKELYPNYECFVENLPELDDEVLVSNGKYIWIDTLLQDGNEVYWDSGHELESTKWMLPPRP